MKKENQEKIAEFSARLEDIIECCATTPNNFAKILGYPRAQTIYDILNRKCAPSYDFFNRFTDSEYSAIIELRWLLNGEGEMWTEFMRGLPHEEQIIVADHVNHGVSVSSFQIAHGSKELLTKAALAEKVFNEHQYDAMKAKTTKLTEENGKLKERAATAEKYYETIIEQSKEIGRLEQRIKDLEQRLGKTADDASIGTTANVG